MDNETLGGGDSALLALLGGPGEEGGLDDGARTRGGAGGRTLASTSGPEMVGLAPSAPASDPRKATLTRIFRLLFLRR